MLYHNHNANELKIQSSKTPRYTPPRKIYLTYGVANYGIYMACHQVSLDYGKSQSLVGTWLAAKYGRTIASKQVLWTMASRLVWLDRGETPSVVGPW